MREEMSYSILGMKFKNHIWKILICSISCILVIGGFAFNGMSLRTGAMRGGSPFAERQPRYESLSPNRHSNAEKSDEPSSSNAPLQFGDDENVLDLISAASDFDLTPEEFDYSRCSLFSTFKVFVPTADHPLAKALSSHPAATSLKNESCLQIEFANLHKSVYSRPRDHSNLLVINLDQDATVSATAPVMIAQSRYAPGKFRADLDFAVHTNVGAFDIGQWKNEPSILPVKRQIKVAYITAEPTKLVNDSNAIQIISCTDQQCDIGLDIVSFCILSPSSLFQAHLLLVLRSGCIPVVMSTSQPLPFQEHLNWNFVALRVPHSLSVGLLRHKLSTIPKEDFLEMRRRGIIFRRRLDNAEALARSLLAAVAAKMQLRLPIAPASRTKPLFTGYESTSIYRVASEQKGQRIPSKFNAQRLHRLVREGQYSDDRWISGRDLTFTPPTLHDIHDLPSETEYYDSEITRTAGSKNAREFSRGLGLNREPEQFTVMMMTYNRDEGVKEVIRKLNNCPHLNKVIIMWNNVDRNPEGVWPKIHVPVEYIRSERNSINNRFLPFDRIETEAIFAIDDDINVSHDELVYAFKVWRQNRDRVVGFFDRYHSWWGDTSKYGSSETCEYSMMISAYFIAHKEFLYEYSYNMHPAIRSMVDDMVNCEDIAFNYLVSHLTRKAPLKVHKIIDHWNAKTKGGLSTNRDHYTERDGCVQKLNAIYGYNPLMMSQVKAVPSFERCMDSH